MFKILKNYANIKFGLSQKLDGPMELAGSGEFAFREIFFAKNHININQTVGAKLAHSENVVLVGVKDRGTVIQNVDGLVTKDADVVLTITVADCYPIYFFAPNENAIGLAHSGWRGSVGTLIENTIKEIKTDPASLFVGIGPGIGLCHFEIRNDTIKKFKDFPNAVKYRGKKIFIDLPKVINHQLIKAGVKPKNIEFIGECTYCEPNKYFSYRSDKPAKIQAMVAYIGL